MPMTAIDHEATGTLANVTRNLPRRQWRAARHAIVGMGLAAVAGLAYLVSLMPYFEAIVRSPAVHALAAAIVLSLASLHFYFRKRFWISGSALFLSVFGMVSVRHVVRMLRLRESFDPASWRIATQWSPFLLFLVCFVLMLAVLAWMLWLFFGPKKEAV